MFSQANFDQLPRELLFGIFSYLKPKAALTVALVNTEFQIAANLACKEKILKLRDLDQCDSDLLIWAQKKSNQAFLNFIYQLAIKKYSVDLFVDIAKRDINKKTILHWAILCRQPIDVIDLLILQGAAINALDSSNNTPLLTALENGHPRCRQAPFEKECQYSCSLWLLWCHAALRRRKKRLSRHCKDALRKKEY